MRTIRGVQRLVVPLLFTSGFLTACYETDPVEPRAVRVNGFELAAYHTTMTAGVADCSAGARRTKVVTISVLGSDGLPANNAVVTMVDPNVVGGNRCWGYTANGVLAVTLPADANRFFTVRTEVSPDAPALEIYPPAEPELLELAWDPAGNRHSPRLVSGRRCDVVTGFGWPELVAAAGDPCRIGSINSFTVQLQSEEDLIDPQILGFDGQGVEDVIIAATSAAGVDGDGQHDPAIADDYCGKLSGFIRQSECLWPASHGPAFLYAMTRTNADGRAPTKLAVGPGNVWIEAIKDFNEGTSLFGTITNYKDGMAIALEPGICKVVKRAEVEENAALDILGPVKSGIGMKFEEGDENNDGIDGLGGTETVVITGVPNSLIVKLTMKANASSTGTLTYTLRYKGGNSSSRSVSFDFAVDKTAGTCTSGDAYGNGLINSAKADFWCTNNGDETYTAIFQVYELNDLSSASFSAKTNPAGGYNGDSLDAQRSDLTAASQPFDLKDLTCPLQLNTDGKLIGIA